MELLARRGVGEVDDLGEARLVEGNSSAGGVGEGEGLS